MLIRPPDEPGVENQEAHQHYEVMQCFTVSQPRSIKEEGEGRVEGNWCWLVLRCISREGGEGGEQPRVSGKEIAGSSVTAH